MTGKQLKQIRLSKGITTYDLQRSGIGSPTYKAIENDGEYKMSSYKKYCKLIGVEN